MARFSYLVDQGVSGGVQKGVKMGCFDPRCTIPIRARAYNDCAQDAVLLKTASKWVSDPKMDPFWGLEMAPDTHRYRLYEHIPVFCVCADMCQNTPPKWGPFWVGRDDHGSYRILKAKCAGLGIGKIARRSTRGGCTDVDIGCCTGGGTHVHGIWMCMCNS